MPAVRKSKNGPSSNVLATQESGSGCIGARRSDLHMTASDPSAQIHDGQAHCILTVHGSHQLNHCSVLDVGR